MEENLTNIFTNLSDFTIMQSVVILGLLIIADYITGYTAALLNNQVTSRKAVLGMIKHGCIFIFVVCISFIFIIAKMEMLGVGFNVTIIHSYILSVIENYNKIVKGEEENESK